MMNTPPDPRRSVVLRLSADQDQSLAGNTLFPERHITLRDGWDSITIGRASKLSSKGFIAGTENAWFDSPVMSRLHARLSVKMDDRKIEIKDLGSLHGTFLNGDQNIPANDAVELRQGDILRFGAPIWRGNEQFVPIVVKVDFQFHTADGGASTFQVPDESDDEDLDDSQSDHSVEVITADAYHNIERSIASAYNAAMAEDLGMDLAGPPTDYPPRHASSLSTPCDSQAHIHDVREPVEGQVETADDVIYDLSNNYELGDPVADENLGDRTILPDDMTDLESNGSPDMDVDHAWYGADEEDDDQDGGQDDHDSLSNQTDDDSQIDYPDEESVSQMDSLESVSVDDMSSIATDDDDMFDDEVAAGGYSHQPEASDSPDNGLLGLESRNDFASWEERSHFPQAPRFPEITRLIDSLSSSPRPNLNQTVPGANTVASIDWLLNSDKPRPPTLMIDKEEQMTPPDSSPATKTAHTLGAMTETIDYSQPRGDNKMVLEAQKAECSRPTSVQDLCNEDEPVNGPSNYMPSPESHPATLSSISPSGQNLFDPTESGPLPGIPSYGPHSTTSPMNLSGEMYGCSRRTHVGISDIVNATQQDVIDRLGQMVRIDADGNHIDADGNNIDADGNGIDRKGKRKAEDISSSTDAEERWAGSVSEIPSLNPSVDKTNTHLEPPAETIQEVITPTAHGGEHRTAGEPETRGRPVKRLRMMRVAERLGYAALGGVTAGAMIVGTLIYTAPTFG